MRILLAARQTSVGPRPVGGVQTWIDTVAAELIRLGNRVKIWQPGVGSRGRFDLGIFAHLDDTREMLDRCDEAIAISHGIVEPERPRPDLVDRTFYVSEEVLRYWGGDEAIDPIVRQPIDLRFWCPSDGVPVRDVVTRFSYRRPEFVGPRAAARVGHEYVHLRGGSNEQIRDALRSSRVVMATGRAAIETMACGTPVVFYDHRAEYMPPTLSTDDVAVQMAHSYSGRGPGSIAGPGVASLVRAMQAAVDVAGLERDWVKTNHDSRAVVEGLLNEVYS